MGDCFQEMYEEAVEEKMKIKHRSSELELAIKDFMYELDRHELRCSKGGCYYQRFKKLLEAK